MPRPTKISEVKQYKEQLTAESILEYAHSIEEIKNELQSYSSQYKEHKKELYSLVLEATANIERAFELLSDPKTTDTQRADLMQSIFLMAELHGEVKLKRNDLLKNIVDMASNSVTRRRFFDSMYDAYFFKDKILDLAPDFLEDEGKINVIGDSQQIHEAMKLAEIHNEANHTKMVREALFNIKIGDKTFAQIAAENPSKVKFTLPSLNGYVSIQLLKFIKYRNLHSKRIRELTKKRYQDYVKMYLDSKKDITIEEGLEDSNLIYEYNIIATRGLNTAVTKLKDINPNLLDDYGIKAIFWNFKNVKIAWDFIQKLKIENLNAYVDTFDTITSLDWITTTPHFTKEQKHEILQSFFKQYEDRGKKPGLEVPLQNLLKNFVKSGIATEADLQKAVQLNILDIKDIERWLYDYGKSLDILEWKIDGKPIYEYCLEDDVEIWSVHYDRKMLVSDYIERTGIIKSDVNFKDLHIQIKQQAVKEAEANPEKAIKELKRVAERLLRSDLVDKDAKSSDRTVLNHIDMNDIKTAQQVLMRIDKHILRDISHRLNGKQIEAMLHNNLYVDVNRQHPLLHIKSVNLKNMLDVNPNMFAKALLNSHVEKHIGSVRVKQDAKAISLLEYMHNKGVKFSKPNLTDLKKAQAQLQELQSQLKDTASLDKVRLEEKIGRIERKIAKISSNISPYLGTSPLESVLNLPVNEINTRALAETKINVQDFIKFATKESEAAIVQILQNRMQSSPELNNKIRDILVVEHHNCKDQERAKLIGRIHEECQAFTKTSDKKQDNKLSKDAEVVIKFALQYCVDHPRKTAVILDHATMGTISNSNNTNAALLTKGNIIAAVRNMSCEEQSKILDSLKFLAPRDQEFNSSFISRIFIKIQILFTELMFGKNTVISNFEKALKEAHPELQTSLQEAIEIATNDIEPDIIEAGKDAIAGLEAELDIGQSGRGL